MQSQPRAINYRISNQSDQTCQLRKDLGNDFVLPLNLKRVERAENIFKLPSAPPCQGPTKSHEQVNDRLGLLVTPRKYMEAAVPRSHARVLHKHVAWLTPWQTDS